MYFHVFADVSPARARELGENLTDGPRRDVAAIYGRLSHAQPTVQHASWTVYDRFLKANRVPEGLRSYDEVVTLVAGTRLDQAGKPLRSHR
jgi:hypothetical protein